MDNEAEYRSKVYSNFNRKPRWKGLIDYKSLVFLISYMFVIWNIVKIFDISLILKSYIIILFTVPIIIVMYIYSSEESVVDMMLTVFKFVIRPKTFYHIVSKSKTIGLVMTNVD